MDHDIKYLLYLMSSMIKQYEDKTKQNNITNLFGSHFATNKHQNMATFLWMSEW